MSDSTDSDGSVIFVAEQHTVRVSGTPTWGTLLLYLKLNSSAYHKHRITPLHHQGIPLQKLSSLKLRVTILGKTQVKKILLGYTYKNSLVKQVSFWSFRKALRAKNLKKYTSLVHSKYSRYSKRAYEHKRNTIKSQKTLMLRKTVIFVVILCPRHPAVTSNSRLST